MSARDDDFNQGPPLRPWVRLGRRTVYSRPPWLTVHLDHVRLPDGRDIKNYHWLETSPYVLVVAETPDGQVLIFEQYRYGVQGNCLCLPGGMIEAGETPEAAAQRELLEETGYVADDWRYLQRLVSNANSGGAICHVLHAKGVRWCREADSGDMEDMNLQIVDKTFLKSTIKEGRFVVISNLAAIAAFLIDGF